MHEMEGWKEEPDMEILWRANPRWRNTSLYAKSNAAAPKRCSNVLKVCMAHFSKDDYLLNLLDKKTELEETY
jgi:hypothetical protein